MTTAVLSPLNGGAAVDLAATLFRKQVLPLGSIDYKGQTITFDREYLTDLADSFQQGAFDQVPFLLADENNKHTLDPERFRGEVRGMELTETGLDAILELTPDAADLVRKTKGKLGVSARLIEGLARADGKTFKRAMHHVLGTLDPRVTGLAPWKEVALSNDDVEETLDFSEAVYNLSDDETQTQQEEAMAVQQDLAQEADDPQIQELFGALLSNDDEGGVPVDLSNDFELELVRATQAETAEQLRAMQVELSNERFTNYAQQLVRDGVPPALIELARPILTSVDAITIDLSNDAGETVSTDVRQVIKSLLEETKGFVDLAVERGHTFDFTAEDHDQAVADAWAKQDPTF